MKPQNLTHEPASSLSITNRSQRWIRERIPYAALLVAGLVFWEVLARVVFVERGQNYFPSIEFIVFQSMKFDDLLITGIQTTVTSIVVGYVVAVIFGVALGIVLAESFVLRQLSLPVVIFSYSIPHAILAPMFFIWFGQGLQTIVAFVVWLAFYNVFVTTLTGVASVSEEFEHLGEVLGATRWQMISKIKFWAALPHITTGLKLAAQGSVVAVIIAEFIASDKGLGYLIVIQAELVRTGLLFGTIAVLIVIAVVWYKLIEFLIDRFVPGPT